MCLAIVFKLSFFHRLKLLVSSFPLPFDLTRHFNAFLVRVGPFYDILQACKKLICTYNLLDCQDKLKKKIPHACCDKFV